MNLQPLKKGDFVEFVERPQASDPTKERWHVVRMRSGTEGKASRFMQPRNYGIWLPLTRIWRPIAQRHMSHAQRRAGGVVKRPQDIPVFPGYMFLKFDINRTDWEKVFEHLGIHGLMCDGDNPTVIRESEIARVRLLEVNGIIPSSTRMSQVLFAIGEEVRVNDGPFKSFNGIIEELPVDLAEKLKTHSIEELDDSFRAKVAVNIFGRSTPVELAFTQIDKL